MIDVFRIDGPTCISLSGGRTSAYLLHLLLKANGGLPSGAVVLFCNTGKEEEATLKFVREIGWRWSVPVVWLEYRGDAEFEVVTFETASRNGEPYEAIIHQRGGILPNPRSRYCSSEMKTRTMHRYLRSIGFTEWDTMLGIRADEPKRVSTFRRNPHPETKAETICIPLADAGVSARDVGDFWRSQEFDLGLPNMNGKTMHGNCDLCFLKPAHQVYSLITEKPERAIWWIKQEQDVEQRLPRREWDETVTEQVRKPVDQYAAELSEYETWLESDEARDLDEDEYPDPPSEWMSVPKLDARGNPIVLHHTQPNTGARFRIDRASYAQMVAYAEKQQDMFDHDEESISCLCGD